ncbi:Zn-ribbon domain-containing OB-fold protein [soil metagenome]
MKTSSDAPIDTLFAPSAREIMAPVPNPETQPFWDAARSGRLALRYCRDCKRYHHYPRALCPFCISDAVEWRDASGRGEIHAFTIMRRASVPYAVAYVELAEGPLMLTNLVRCDFDALEIGAAVTAVFDTFEGGALPVFTVVARRPAD